MPFIIVINLITTAQGNCKKFYKKRSMGTMNFPRFFIFTVNQKKVKNKIATSD